MPVDWRLQRRLGVAELDGALRFVDVAVPETRACLTRDLAEVLAALGVTDLDLSVITSNVSRRATQEIARYIYERLDDDGQPRFAGIRYISRLDAGWELWAIFHDRLRGTFHPSASIFADDPGLVAACERLGLEPPRHF